VQKRWTLAASILFNAVALALVARRAALEFPALQPTLDTVLGSTVFGTVLWAFQTKYEGPLASFLLRVLSTSVITRILLGGAAVLCALFPVIWVECDQGSTLSLGSAAAGAKLVCPAAETVVWHRFELSPMSLIELREGNTGARVFRRLTPFASNAVKYPSDFEAPAQIALIPDARTLAAIPTTQEFKAVGQTPCADTRATYCLHIEQCAFAFARNGVVLGEAAAEETIRAVREKLSSETKVPAVLPCALSLQPGDQVELKIESFDQNAKGYRPCKSRDVTLTRSGRTATIDAYDACQPAP